MLFKMFCSLSKRMSRYVAAEITGGGLGEGEQTASTDVNETAKKTRQTRKYGHHRFQ